MFFDQLDQETVAWARTGDDLLHSLRFAPHRLEDRTVALPRAFLGFGRQDSDGTVVLVGTRDGSVGYKVTFGTAGPELRRVASPGPSYVREAPEADMRNRVVGYVEVGSGVRALVAPRDWKLPDVISPITDLKLAGSGEVVGSLNFGRQVHGFLENWYRPVLWDPTGRVSILSLPKGQRMGGASAISHSGIIVGFFGADWGIMPFGALPPSGGDYGEKPCLWPTAKSVAIELRMPRVPGMPAMRGSSMPKGASAVPRFGISDPKASLTSRASGREPRRFPSPTFPVFRVRSRLRGDLSL